MSEKVTPYRRHIEEMRFLAKLKREAFKANARLLKRAMAPPPPPSPPHDEEAIATDDMEDAPEINNDGQPSPAVSAPPLAAPAPGPVYDDAEDNMEDDGTSSSPEIIDLTRGNADEEDYYWANFINESRQVFASKEELMDFFTTNFPRVCYKINLRGGFYLKKEHKGLLYNYVKVEDLKACSFSYKEIITTAKRDTLTQQVTLPLGSVLEQSRVPVYSHVICDPKATANGMALNTWRPLRADIKIDYNIYLAGRIKSYIYNVICNRNDHMSLYLMTWLRQVCLFPEKQTGKVLVFQSSSNAGESFVNWLSKHVFGPYSADHMSLEEVKKKGNMRLMNKVFVSIDGLPTTSTRFCNVFDSLNYLRRGAEIDMGAFKINNLLNFVMLTKPMRLEAADERYVIFTIDGGRDNYGDNLFTEESAIDFFNYLTTPDPSLMWTNLNDIPMSVGVNLNSMELFLKEVRERTLNDVIRLKSEDERAINHIPVNEKVAVRKADLFQVYSDYCQLKGKECLEAKRFNDYLDEKLDASSRYYLV